MATPVAQVVKVNWKLVFPWLALFRALGLALHVRQVVVGMAAALLIAIGELVIGGIPFPQKLPEATIDASLFSWVWLPWVDLIFPLLPPRVFSNFTIVTQLSWWSLIQSLLRFSWILVVGSLAGGVLVRRAGMEFAREESVGLIATCRFVVKRSIDYLSAPALPLAMVFLLGSLLWGMGLFARFIPGGNYLVSAVWGLVLLVGIVMAVIAVAVLLGWPMMVAAVSINGGDGFDGLSRGFGFVLDRWRYYAWCLGIMTAYGCLSLLMLLIILQLGSYLAITHLSWGGNGWDARDLPRVLPPFVWPNLIGFVLRGFAYSFFWSSISLIYLVLRQSLDNAELHDIYVEGTPQDPDDLQALLNPQTPTAPPTLLPIINQP